MEALPGEKGVVFFFCWESSGCEVLKNIVVFFGFLWQGEKKLLLPLYVLKIENVLVSKLLNIVRFE